MRNQLKQPPHGLEALKAKKFSRCLLLSKAERLTEQVQEDSTAILGVCVGRKVNLLLAELVQQFLHYAARVRVDKV